MQYIRKMAEATPDSAPISSSPTTSVSTQATAGADEHASASSTASPGSAQTSAPQVLSVATDSNVESPILVRRADGPAEPGSDAAVGEARGNSSVQIVGGYLQKLGGKSGSAHASTLSPIHT